MTDVATDSGTAPDLRVELKGSLRKDGSRDWVHPADVQGRFTRLRRWAFSVLMAIYLALPWLSIGGHPALFFDVPNRRFFLFGLTFNAQDAWLLFFVVTGVGFLLLVLAALLGRVWCGYACPQTVFLEGVYRRIERWLEGPRNTRLRRDAAAWTLDTVVRKGIKHVLFVALSAALASVLVSYFSTSPGLFGLLLPSAAVATAPLVWASVMAVLLYLNFGFFREQLCLIVCPYGRLQSALMDQHSLIVGYDASRGEPRGKASDPVAGACVDCDRCVVVCPTGIDIRHGLQLDCIGCANCIDACDEVMTKLKRPRGLIRYDSLVGLAGNPRKLWRPRVFLYGLLGVVGATVMGLSVGTRQPYEATIRRLPTPFSQDAGQLRNGFEIHLTNKDEAAHVWHLEPAAPHPAKVVLPTTQVELAGFASRRIPVFVTLPEESWHPGQALEVKVIPQDPNRSTQVIKANLLGPASGNL